MSVNAKERATEGGHSCPPNGGLENPPSVSCDEWLQCRLEVIAKTTSGGTPDRKRTDFYGGAIAWVKSGELNDSYIFSTEETLTPEGLKHSSAKLFPAGTLLMAMYGATVGRTAILRMDAATNQAVCAIFPSAEKADADFLRYFLIGERQELLKQRYGGAQPNISQNVIRNFPVRLPPLPEQRQIAEVLGLVQRAMEQQERLIALITELKKTLLHQLFTQGLRHEPQKQTDIGPVPESWKVVRLSDVCELIIDCPHTTPKFRSDGVRVIRNFNIRDGAFVEEPASFTSEEEYHVRTARAVPLPGDILFSREAPVGEACVIPDGMKVSLGQRTMLLRTNAKLLDATFMVHNFYSSNVRGRMLATASGLTVAHINVSDVRGLLVPVPHLDEQKETAAAINAVADKLRVHRIKHATLTALFRTLLHQLMTARIRVHKLELPELEAATTE